MLCSVRSFAQFQLHGLSSGADVIVEGNYGEIEREPMLKAVWRNVPGARAEFALHRSNSAAGEANWKLDRLLETALGAYLDARIHFSREGVHSDLSASALAMEMNAMIFSALAGLDAQADIGGLSPATRQQLDRLIRIDWSQARTGIDGGHGEDKYLAIYFYVRNQREELEKLVRADLLPLAQVPVIADESEAPGRSVQVASTCGTVFDDEEYLCALDLQLADTGAGSIDPELAGQLALSLEAKEEEEEEKMRVRKRDRWLKAELDRINQRIDKMDQRKEIWELRDRMDDLEDRLTGLEMELRDVGKGSAREAENPIADLSDLTGLNITIRFDRYSTSIAPEYLPLLNEVFEQLARSPNERVLITGYSDRSGDPAGNLRLSEERARSVRDHLLLRGIAGDRLLMNYYGDSRSDRRDPSQRRVEIEWLGGSN